MPKELLVSSSDRETRIAVLEEGRVAEVQIERRKQRGTVGNIYKGRVTRVLPGMQSAFVDIGLEKDAFLYVADVGEEAEGLVEDFLKLREIIFNRGSAFLPLDIVVYHSAADGSRPVKRNKCYEVLKPVRGHLHEDVPHARTFKLENTYGVPRAQKIICCHIFKRYIFQQEFREKMLKDLENMPKPKVDRRYAGDYFADPKTASAIRLDERILNYIKGLNYIDDRLAPFLAPITAGLDGAGPAAVLVNRQPARGALVTVRVR